MKAKEILTNIKCIKKCLGKSDLTSGNKYRITLTYNNKTVWFIYNDNYMNKSDLKDILYCLILDATAYENAYNFADFCNEFGYDSDSMKAYKIYQACKKQLDRYNKLFTQEEKDFLQNLLQDY